MKRREFITLLGGAAVAWPAAAAAQQSERTRRIAMLMARIPTSQTYQAALVQGLRDLGWIVDRNITIEHRWVAADAERLRGDAEALVALNPDVILTDTSPSVAALQRATRSVPVVFMRLTDPLGQGFVASLARPGGNATGFTDFEPAITGKWVELLKEMAPGITRVALLHNPQTAPYSRYFLPPFEAAARKNGIEPISVPVRNVAELEASMTVQGREAGGAFVAQADSFVSLHRGLIIAAAAHHRLPAIYSSQSYSRAGGLMSYGSVAVEMYRQGALYVDRILKGVDPADLPVQAPTKFELVINVGTAKMLGLDIPPGLLATANDVIE
jgi:putative ABC transport system substrate-binding protein